jgi:chromosome segregation protein
MSLSRRVLLCLALVAAMTGAACGDPPDKEMQQAQAAIDAARAAGADRFARDEFAAAEDALKRSHDAVAQRDYRQALNTALDARERAQLATKEATDRKAIARTDAEHALAAADGALHDARAKLKNAETARAATKSLAAARRSIANEETAMQEAHATFDRGDYLAATEASHQSTGRLRETTRDLETAPTSGRGTAHRRH